MPIQLTKSRRGLYTIEEYKIYRGEFKDLSNNLIPLPAGYEPIIYGKCLKNSHQFPTRPETGNRYMPYQEFLARDLLHEPLLCPYCQEQNLVFKYCKLEDQPRTFNDLNHQHIKKNREIIDHPYSLYYHQNEVFMGIARPYYEDYFPAGHSIIGTSAPGNHDDPFAEQEVIEKTGSLYYSSTAAITSPIPKQAAIPLNDVYDASGKYLEQKQASIRPEFPAVPAYTGKYLKMRKNYDFYRAILYIIAQYQV